MPSSRWSSLRATGREVSARMTEHRVSLAAGGMSFFVALAIAPAAIAFGSIAGLVLDSASVRASLESLIARTPSLEPLSAIVDPVVTVVEQASGRGFSIATTIGFLVAVFAASRVVVSMRQALDAAFGVVDRRSGLLQRAAATLVTCIGILLSVVVVAILAVLPRVLDFLGVSSGPWTAMPLLGSLLAAVAIYPATWLLYRFGPHRRGAVPFASAGVALATVGVLAASIGVGLYVQVSSTVGATLALFGAPMVVLLWLYFVALALLAGAETAAVLDAREADPDEVTVLQHR